MICGSRIEKVCFAGFSRNGYVVSAGRWSHRRRQRSTATRCSPHWTFLSFPEKVTGIHFKSHFVVCVCCLHSLVALSNVHVALWPKVFMSLRDAIRDQTMFFLPVFSLFSQTRLFCPNFLLARISSVSFTFICGILGMGFFPFQREILLPIRTNHPSLAAELNGKRRGIVMKINTQLCHAKYSESNEVLYVF